MNATKKTFLLILFVFYSFPSFSQNLPGDVTQDGVLDGRDALLILRAIEGLEPMTDEMKHLGDIYPAGAVSGDGVLNKDDAMQILRTTLDLVPLGEITGDFSQSPPKIERFEPAFGPVGTPVTIEGSNFVNSAVANAVWFGNTAAPILQAANNRIVTQVPPGAVTSIIRVQTPGGMAYGKDEFVVTVPQKGVLVLPPGLQSGEFTISSGYSTTDSFTADGGFTIPIADKRINLIAAVPKGDGNHSFMALWLPGDTGSQPRQVDSSSTAKALTYLCPFFTTDDVNAVRSLVTIMDGLPEMIAFEKTIQQRFPERVEGLEDPAVGAAWDAAVMALVNALPTSLVLDMNENAVPAAKTGAERYRVFKWMAPLTGISSTNRLIPHAASKDNTLILGVDRNYLGAALNDKGGLLPELEMYSPIDWVAVLYQLDVNDLPKGINEPLRDLIARGPKVIGQQQGTLLSAKQWTANIDITYTLVDKAVQSIVDYIWSPDASLPLGDRDGVFALHGFSGVVSRGDRSYEDYEAMEKIPGGMTNHNMATAINLMIAAIDTWELIDQDSATFKRSVIKAGIKNAMRKLSQEFSTINPPKMTFKDWVRLLWSTHAEIEKAALATLAVEAPKLATEKLSKTLANAGAKAQWLLAALGKVALVGKVAERIAGLAGSTFTVNPFSLAVQNLTLFTAPNSDAFGAYPGPRPLESMLVVVGDPFSPTISSIDPTMGGRNTILTVRGYGFSPNAQDNTVVFQETGQDFLKIPGKVIEASPNGTELKVQAPVLVKDISYDVILTTASCLKDVKAPNSFLYRWIPSIVSISPLYGFPALPDNSKNPITGMGRMGTQISLQVQDYEKLPDNENPHQLFIGDVKIPSPYGIIQNYVIAFIPDISPGKYPIYFRCPKFGGIESNRVDFTVLPAPDILQIEPEEAAAGQLVSVIGFNFGDWFNSVALQIGDRITSVNRVEPNRITFNMPYFEESGQTYPLKIWTPSGVSNEKRITFRKGGAEYNPVPLPPGWTLTVTGTSSGKEPDGKLNLDEAAAIGRGEINPFLAPWDDVNIIEEKNYHETKDANGTISWREGTTEKSTKPGSVGQEYHYVYSVYHALDGSINRTLNSKISLDAGNDAEEGDFIGGNSPEEGGQYYRDTILVPYDSTGDFYAADLKLGANDSLQMPYSNQVLRLAMRGLTLLGDSDVHINTIDSPLDVAITLNGASGNKLVVDRLMNAPQTAVRIMNSWFNHIQAGIESGLGDGVVIEGGGQNVLGGSIQNVQGNGAIIRNSHYNTISSKIVQCSQTGIVLENGRYNLLKGLQVSDCLQNGLLVDNSDSNTIESCRFQKNETGCILQGSQCKENRFQDCVIGIPENSTEKMGNRKHGLHVRSGASSNRIANTQISGNAEYGVLIEGTDVVSNAFLSDTGRTASNQIARNGKDGLLLRNEASKNRIASVEFYGNGGNGITITGSNTTANVVYGCGFGRASNGMDVATYLPNEGWGLVVEDEAPQTLIEYCYFSTSRLGNLLVDKVKQTVENDYSIAIHDCSFGYNRFIDYSSSGLDREQIKNAYGNALVLHGVLKAHLYRLNFYGHDEHLSLDESEECLVQDLYGSKARKYSIHIVRGERHRFNKANTSGDVHSVFAEETQLCSFESIGVGSRNGNGLCLNACREITVTDSNLGYAQAGVIVSNSTDIRFSDCKANNNQTDGVLVNGESSRVTFERVHSQQNIGTGYRLENCDGIKIYGTDPREGLFISDNKTGILIRNARNIDIGYRGKGVNLYNFWDQGIWIDGENTEKIRIVSSMINNRGSVGIRVSHGKNILIGGLETEDRNNIEYSQDIGILVEKEPEDVSIVNNLFGEPEEWETGAKRNGLLTAIQLNGARGTFVHRNLLNNNHRGIVLQSGATGNQIVENQITENISYGVQVDGAQTIENTISRNYFRDSNFRAIALLNGGNKTIEPPVVNKLQWEVNNIAGTCNAPDGSSVEVYALDRELVQYRLIAACRVFGKSFSASGRVEDGESVCALVIHPDGNTSEIGPSYLSESFSGAQSPFVYSARVRGDLDIFLQENRGNAPKRLTDTAADDQSPKFSKDGRRILFVSERSGNPDIWMMDNDGTGAQSLTNHATPEYDPAWMGNEKFVYVSERDGNPEIYLDTTNLLGDGVEVFYHNGEPMLESAEMKDGAFAVHFSVPNGAVLSKIGFWLTYDVYAYPSSFAWKIVPFDNEPSATVLAEGTATATGGGWNEIILNNLEVPAEFAVCYVFENDLRPALMTAENGAPNRCWDYDSYFDQWSANSGRHYMVKAVYAGAKAEPVRLTFDPAIDRQPAVSFDGEKIAFSSNRGGTFDIWLMDAQGASLERLTDGAGNNDYPAWSPKGDSILFVSDRDGNNDIYRIDTVSHAIVRITNHSSDDTHPIWTRDGGKVFFSSNRTGIYQIYSLSTGAVTPKQITYNMCDSIQPDLGPNRLPLTSVVAKQTIRTNAIAQSHSTALNGTLALSLPFIDAKPGDTIRCPLRISGANAVGNVSFLLGYDDTVMKIDGIVSLFENEHTMFAVNPESYPSWRNPVHSNWIRSIGFDADAELMAVLFTISANAEIGEYPITFKSIQGYDVHLQPVEFAVENGLIRIEENGTGVKSWMIY